MLWAGLHRVDEQFVPAIEAQHDTGGDAIDSEARAAGQRAFEGSKNGNIAAIAFAAALAGRRSWVDPYRARSAWRASSISAASVIPDRMVRAVPSSSASTVVLNRMRFMLRVCQRCPGDTRT